MQIRFSTSNRVYIKNTTNAPIKILVAPNKDWIMGDLAFTVAKCVLTYGTSTAAETVTETVVKTAFKTGVMYAKNLFSLYGIYSKVKKVSKLNSHLEQQQNAKKTQETMQRMFDESCITIAPGETAMVNEKSLAASVTGVMRYLVVPLMYATMSDHDNSKEIQEISKLMGGGKDVGVVDLFEQIGNVLNLANPSTFSSIFSSVGDLTIFAATDKYDRFVAFNTNSDHSWIVKQNDIVRAKYGTTAVEDIEEGRHFFSLTLGEGLEPGDTMDPYDSLDVVTSNYNALGELELGRISPAENLKEDSDDGFFTKAGKFVYNAHAFVRNVQYNIINTGITAVEGTINFPKYVGSAPYKLTYQPDGNLVLYRMSGDSPTAKWATQTDGTPTYKTIMQEDGNLVVYAAPGKPVWALWRATTPAHRDAYIKLDNITGDINYYLKDHKQPLFAINTLQFRKINGITYPIIPNEPN